MQTQDILAMLDDADRRIETFACLSPAVHSQRYAEGKWHGREVLGHLADADLVFFYRFLKAAAEPGGSIEPFDEAIWSPELQLDQRPAAISLGMIRAVHAALRHHLETLPADTLERSSKHVTRGPQTARAIAIQLVRHSLHHAGQLDAIREGRSWTIAEAVAY